MRSTSDEHATAEDIVAAVPEINGYATALQQNLALSTKPIGFIDFEAAEWCAKVADMRLFQGETVRGVSPDVSAILCVWAVPAIDAPKMVAAGYGTYEPGPGAHQPEVVRLIAAAAEAQELFGDDALEAHAAELRQKNAPS